MNLTEIIGGIIIIGVVFLFVYWLITEEKHYNKRHPNQSELAPPDLFPKQENTPEPPNSFFTLSQKKPHEPNIFHIFIFLGVLAIIACLILVVGFMKAAYLIYFFSLFSGLN